MKSVNIFFSCFLVFAFISCAMPNKNTAQDNNNLDRTLNDWDLLSKGTQCAIEQSKQVVIKSEADFATLWKEAFSGVDMAPEQPEVDFSQKWVIAVFLGMTNKGGHEVDITGIAETGTATVVNVLHTAPGKNCMSTMSIEFPYMIIMVNPFKKATVEFKTTLQEKDCN